MVQTGFDRFQQLFKIKFYKINTMLTLLCILNLNKN